MAGGGHGTRAVVAAMLANAGIATAKFIGFALTRSGAMLAEAVHSVADTGNQALLLLGGRRARKAATAEHPFGYARERYFWSFVVAMILFSLGGMFAIYEGVEKIRHPHALDSAEIAIAILAVGILLEALSFRTAIVEARKVKEPGTGWWGFIRRSKNPELPVVLLEDLGAQVGLVLALAAVLTAEATGEPVWDGYGTLAIGILLVIIAVILAVEMKGLLIGEAASETDQQRIAAAIEIEPSVTRLLHMRTQHLGPEELLVGAKIELVPGLSVEEVSEVVNRVEASVRRAVPTARILYLEPDVFRTAMPTPTASQPASSTPAPADPVPPEAETTPAPTATGPAPPDVEQPAAEPAAAGPPGPTPSDPTAPAPETVPAGPEPPGDAGTGPGDQDQDEDDRAAASTGERGESGAGEG